jgi:HAD superfamily hydrolase (TIGR01509 family)
MDAVFPKLTEAERAAVFADAYAYETNQMYSAVPGVIDLLRALRENDIAVALVTSGEKFKVAEVFRQLEIGDLFSAVVTAEDVPKGKPHPACYLLGAKRLDVPPERCVVFEDSISGVQAAVGAGTHCIGVRPARTAPALLAEGARGVIPNFSAARVEADKALWLSEGLRVGFSAMQSC